MGLATIINMICYVCVPAWGDWAATLAWALWWIDAVISVANNMYLPFAMYETLFFWSFHFLTSLLNILTQCQNVPSF